MTEMYVPTDMEASAVAKLAATPQFLDDLARDPREALGKLGLAIDDATAAAIQAQAKTPLRSSTYQAAIVHVDT